MFVSVLLFYKLEWQIVTWNVSSIQKPAFLFGKGRAKNRDGKILQKLLAKVWREPFSFLALFKNNSSSDEAFSCLT